MTKEEIIKSFSKENQTISKWLEHSGSNSVRCNSMYYSYMEDILYDAFGDTNNFSKETAYPIMEKRVNQLISDYYELEEEEDEEILSDAYY